MAFSRRSWGLHCWTKVITEHNNWESHRSINVCLITGCRKTTFLKITFLSCFLTAQQSIALMKALPDLFQSPVAPPKKLGHASEALLHILKVRKCICIRIFTFTLPYNTKSALWYFFFFLCLSAYRRPQHLSTSKTTLQPGRCCQWNWLHTIYWNHACVDFPKRGYRC